MHIKSLQSVLTHTLQKLGLRHRSVGKVVQSNIAKDRLELKECRNVDCTPVLLEF
jgi:hypothetical protein